MILWGWLILQLFIQTAVVCVCPMRIGRGRILTRPLWRFRLFRPYVSPYTGNVLASYTRMKQIAILMAVFVSLAFAGLLHGYRQVIFQAVIIALYVDDYVTGDDDRWKRFKSWARNAVRWKMALPKPAAR